MKTIISILLKATFAIGAVLATFHYAPKIADYLVGGIRTNLPAKRVDSSENLKPEASKDQLDGRENEGSAKAQPTQAERGKRDKRDTAEGPYAVPKRWQKQVDELKGAEFARLTTADRATLLGLIEREQKLEANPDQSHLLAVRVQTVEFCRSKLGGSSLTLGAGLNNLGAVYNSLGRHGEALTILKEALAIGRRLLPPDHPDIALSLYNLGNVYNSLGRHGEALASHSEALAIRRKVLPPEHPRIAASLNNLGAVYSSLGRHGEALASHNEALAIHRRVLPSEHPRIAGSLTNLGLAYNSLGRYGEALASHSEALAIQRKMLSPDHPDIAVSLNNLGAAYGSLGRHREALASFREALMIQRKALRLDHRDLARGLNNLGNVYFSLGLCVYALDSFREALAIQRKALSPDHPDIAGSLNNLGIVYNSLGRHGEALGSFSEALAIQRKVLSPDHPDIAGSLNNLGAVYNSLGRYREALGSFSEALAIRRKVLHSEHPRIADCLNNLGLAYNSLGRHGEALACFSQMRKLRNATLAKIFSFSSESDRMAWMASFDPFSAAAKLGDGPELAACALAFKGIVLDSVAEDRGAAQAAADPAVKTLLECQAVLRGNLRQAVLEGGTGRIPKADYDRFTAELAEADREIARKVSGYGQARKSLSAGVPQVKSALPEGAALIEVVAHWHFRSAAEHKADPALAAERRYVAAVITREGEARFADLGSVEEVGARLAEIHARLDKIFDLEEEGTISKLLEMERAKASELRQPCRMLHRLLVEPIERVLAGSQVKSLILSPDGELNFVPFAALLDARGRLLCERYELRMVSSGRDLVKERERAEAGNGHSRSAVLVAPGRFDGEGPRFALDEDQENPETAHDERIAQAMLSRGRDASTLRSLGRKARRQVFKPLRGTEAEVGAVKDLLGKAGWQVETLLGEKATEEALKRVDRPAILHLATHGFFLDAGEVGVRRNPLEQQMLMGISGGPGGGMRPLPPVENPMLRGGFLMAGGDTTFKLWREGKAPPEGRDGVVLAAQVPGLKLRGTELVVLSACDTARGEARDGEGVLGLRRAFAMCGVRNLMLTLWPVGDRETVGTMREFYTMVAAGEDPSRALWKYQREALPKLQKEIGLDLAIRHAAPFVLTSVGRLNQAEWKPEKRM